MKTLNTSARLNAFDSASRVTIKAFGLSSTWNQVWQRLITAMTENSDLQVWTDDRNGKLQWHSYDPLTGRCFSGSEAEMRSWIESRYSN
jgi:hypothetical protein